MLHFYDFIDMVPFIEDMEVFNPCNVYNTGKPQRATVLVVDRCTRPIGFLGWWRLG